MRPRQLRLSAFGPYPDVVEVDFDALAEEGLFLIHGPTGAGKTSLLDGICFALYGRVPGDRDSDRLRSDHAGATATEVRLTFSVRDEDWSVTRVPPHERPKRTGAGTTKQKPKATLSKWARDGYWVPVADGAEEVGDAIVALLGLRREQFQQVVVLPQGQIQQALQAGAKDRASLLSSLFDTGRFGDYTARIADLAAQREEQTRVAAHALGALRELAGQLWAGIAPYADEAPPEPPADQSDLNVFVKLAVATRQDVEEAAADAERDDRLRRDELSAAALINERWRRRSRAERTLAELGARTGQLDAARASLDGALRASACRPALAAVAHGRRASDEGHRRLDTALATVPELAGRLPPLLAGLRDDLEGLPRTPVGTLAVERLCDRAAQAGAEVSELVAQHAEGLAARGEHDRLVVDAERLTGGAICAARDADDLSAQQLSVHHGLDRARAAALDEGRLAEAAEQLQAQAVAATQLEEAEAAYREAHRVAVEAGSEANSAERAHLDAYRARLEGIAAELANRLTDGEPCEVCGGTDHPRPAAGEHCIDDEAVAAAEAEAVASRAAAAAREAHADELRNWLEEVRRDAGPAADDPQAGARRAASAVAELEEAREQAAAVTSLEETAEAVRRQLLAAIARDHDHRERAAVARTRAEAARRLADRTDQRMAAAFGSRVDPREIASTVERLGTLLEEARIAAGALREADAVLRDGEQRLARLLEQQDFPDAAAASAAWLPEQRQASLRQQLDEADAQRRGAESVLSEPELARLPPAPDLPALQRASAASEAVVARLQRRAGVVRRGADELEQVARRHATQAAALEPLEQQAEQARRLANVCQGSGNALRMSLERYVLAAYLEEITGAASQRLRAMTDGRYSLRHSDVRARRGAASGLAITVCDAFTGVDRDVGSLSGGETFQASLALALGVADVVQRHAGGVHLDTLFVDEGFGALDADALELAMGELDRLREGGRLVGVISHVIELRERIRCGIAVTRGRGGSSARVTTTSDA